MLSASHGRISRDPRTWMPGSWEPGRIRLEDTLVIKAVLIMTATVRGLDYLAPKPPLSTPAVESMRVAFPLAVWGLLFVIPAAVLLLGLLGRIHVAVWLGHGLLAVVYLALAVALGSEYVTHPWWNGIRSATGLLLPVGLHAMICLRTGWRPITWRAADE